MDEFDRSIHANCRSLFPGVSAERADCLQRHRSGLPGTYRTDCGRLCYSTTDIFAAGFQDHGIGKILGINHNTGAGGANVWTQQLLQELLTGPNSPLKPLPKNASFRVAARRSIRVGAHAGELVEDIGIVPDEYHAMTHDDVLNGNIDLKQHACNMLRNSGPVASLTADIKPGPAGSLTGQVITKYIDALTCISTDAGADTQCHRWHDTVHSAHNRWKEPRNAAVSDRIALLRRRGLASNCGRERAAVGGGSNGII